MKIAMVTEYFWPYDLGGSERSTYYLAREIIKYGHQVIVITPNYGAKGEEVLKDIKIIRIHKYKLPSYDDERVLVVLRKT